MMAVRELLRVIGWVKVWRHRASSRESTLMLHRLIVHCGRIGVGWRRCSEARHGSVLLPAVVLL